ncbi:MAG: AarF/ABC1/UbiB kinase family protein [Acidimicrobiales bacterium]|nr:AarF/ABC1/UbiB kinase family protein [Acidimicrobiales bacterium]
MAADWLPTGRVRRAATPARLIIEGAAVAAVAKAKALRGGSLEELADDARLVAAAERIARQLGEMKGAAMKLGQVLSFVDVGLVPQQLRGALAALQADAPPMPYDLVAQVITAELGAPPEELFDFFSRGPIASASIGQVHMAHRGEDELVVKVQYPGIARAVEADLRNAALLSMLARVTQRLLADLVGSIDTRAVIDELRERVTEELDYRIEARNQAEFAVLHRADPWLGVPEVIEELSSRRVLTSRYVDGLRWSAAKEAPQELRDRWGQAMCRFQWVSLFRDGITNLDPHPGNYLFHDDGRVTFLDFGACQRYDADQLRRLSGLAIAAMSQDDQRMLDALVDMGILKGLDGIDPDTMLLPMRLAIEPATTEPQPFQFTGDFVARQVGQVLRIRFGKEQLRIWRQLDAPPELPMFLRIVLGTAGIVSQLGAAVHFQDVLDEALDGYPGHQPYRIHP